MAQCENLDIFLKAGIIYLLIVSRAGCRKKTKRKKIFQGCNTRPKFYYPCSQLTKAAFSGKFKRGGQKHFLSARKSMFIYQREPENVEERLLGVISRQKKKAESFRLRPIRLYRMNFAFSVHFPRPPSSSSASLIRPGTGKRASFFLCLPGRSERESSI